MPTLTVGAGQEYTTIASAVAAAQNGDTVQVQAGTYVNDFFTISTSITLESVGGTAYDIASGASPPNGKAIATVDASATIDGFGFSGAQVSDGNGAGIRYEAGNLVVDNSVFWDNQDGILGGAVPGGTILIENSEFSSNGSGDGYTHNIYIGDIASFTLLDSYVHDANLGHEVKSRAQNNVIEGNRIFDNTSDASYSIDLPNGGNDLVEGNTIEKGANSPNYTTVHFGGEGTPYANSSLNVTGNTVIADDPAAVLVNNQSGLSTVTATSNQLYGYTAPNGGAVTASGNTVLTTRPTLDLTTMAPAVDETNNPIIGQPTAQVPAGVQQLDPGPGGAVAASGHVLLVGANQAYTTLGAALAASRDGDTIDVMAGNYVDDFGTVNHKVIIQGVGGIAHFSEAPGLLDTSGLLQINNDVTLANLSFSGVHDYDGHAGGIAIHSGNVTINNSEFDGNDQAIDVDNSATISLSIYNSEISGNGNNDKGTDNLSVGQINSFVLKGSAVHGAFSGHEIGDSAYNTDIENNRIWDGAGVGASYGIDLSRGGNAVIADNVIEKGPDSQNDISILDGGEGPTYSNSNVAISGNTFVSDLDNPDHPYTFFIVGASGTYAAPPTSVTDNTFVGGIPGSTETQNVAGLGGNVVAASATVDMTTPGYSGTLAPPVPAPSSTANYDTLTVSLADAIAVVGAGFLVSVDGTAIGGGVTKADDPTQPPQTFTFTGNWGTGSHTVTVTGINLGTADATENPDLYVDGITLDGASAPPGTTTLDGGTTSTSTVLTATLPDFDAAYYLAHNPDVAAAGVDPLQHYMQYGWKEGRNPDAFFNTTFYLNQNPDVAASGINPLVQFEQTGWKEGLDPSALFSVSQYLANNPDVARAGIDPLQEYLQDGEAEGRATYAATPHDTVTTDPLIDSAYYYANNPAIAATGEDAGVAYHANVWTSTANPDAYFDTAYYLEKNPDVAAAHFDPLLHYEEYGWKEGRDPSAYFSTRAYEAANPSAAASLTDPLAAFLQSGTAPSDPTQSVYASPEAKYFDAAYYLAENPDVAAAHVDPLIHYEQYGWKEGRNASASFDTSLYLQNNRDVARAGMDPLLHYAEYGVFEGRAIYAVPGS